jgi:tetratricopeptide (TPR) repeat protein
MSDVTRADLPATREELEAERVFLFASLDDLETERAAGGMDDATYQQLVDDYTARAAAVVRALDAVGAAQPVAPTDEPRSRWRTPVIATVIVLFVGLSAVALWGALSNRSSGETLTGKNVATPDQQRSLLEADVAKNPNDPAARRAYARYLLTQREYAAALKQFDQAAALDPNDAESRAYGGWVTYLAGLPDRALVRLDAALAIDPQYADAYFFRGMVYFRGQNNAAKAIPEFERFLAIAPDSPLAQQVQGVLSAARQTITNAPTTVPATTGTK